MKHLIATAAIVLGLVVAGSLFFCGCEPSTKSLVDGYKLGLFNENGEYYVTAPDDSSANVVFDGAIEEIGWNQHWIVAQVKKMYLGDTNGWYALNVKTKQVIGPIQEPDLSTNVEWSNIKYCAPELVKNKW